MLKREQKRGRPGQTVEVVRNVEDKKLERTGMCGELLL